MWRFLLFAAIVYAILTMFLLWPMTPIDTQRIIGCACGDSALQAWFLDWVPHAILHGHNPFFTTYMDYPKGVNLASNTTVPILAILFYPVTALWGAIATFNLLMWLAYPLSAVSAFFVVRQWTRSNIAAFAAGLFYGFSPYIVHQGYGHLALNFVPLPPLIFYFLYRLFADQRGHPLRWGVGLGLLVSAQFLISAEILVTTLMIGVGAIVLWLLTCWRDVTRERLVFLVKSLTPAVALAIVILAFPVWSELFGKYHVTAPNQNGILNPYRTDLLGAIVPTSMQRFGTTTLKTLGNHFSGNQVENGSYLGLPLVVLFLGCWIRYFRHRWIRIAGLTAVSAWIISLGPWLTVKAHVSNFKLPFEYLTRFQIFQDVLPVRFSLYVAFFVVVTVALSIGVWSKDQRHRDATRSRLTTFQALSAGLVAVLLAASVLAIYPTLPTPNQSTQGATPAFFTSPAANAIPAGSVILTYPIALPVYSQAPIIWQFQSHFRWKMMGGYAEIPGLFPNTVTPFPWPTTPYSVVNYLQYWEGALHDTQLSNPFPLITPQLITQTRQFIARYRISSVIVDLAMNDSAPVVQLFTKAFGTATTEGGVDAWLHLTSTSK